MLDFRKMQKPRLKPLAITCAFQYAGNCIFLADEVCLPEDWSGKPYKSCRYVRKRSYSFDFEEKRKVCKCLFIKLAVSDNPFSKFYLKLTIYFIYL